nr:hypothetical protein [Clostridioides difficile]
MSKSAITPSFIGLISTIFPGVLPILFLASTPTVNTSLLSSHIATTFGSFTTVPCHIM